MNEIGLYNLLGITVWTNARLKVEIKKKKKIKFCCFYKTRIDDKSVTSTGYKSQENSSGFMLWKQITTLFPTATALLLQGFSGHLPSKWDKVTHKKFVGSSSCNFS